MLDLANRLNVDVVAEGVETRKQAVALRLKGVQYLQGYLFHVYTPEYNSYPWRLELGKFYASKMSEELPFEYYLLDLRQTESIDSAFDKVACAIEGKIRSEFSGNIAQL